MTPVQNLFIVVEDLIYSNNMTIEIIMPYWNKKKDFGPQLAELLRNAGLLRVSSTPEEWVVMTDRGCKRIHFTTSKRTKYKFSDVIIIPDG